MHSLSIIQGDEVFPAETVRVEPLARGRVSIFIKTSLVLSRGQSCVVRNSANVETHCVVADVSGLPNAQVIELRCIMSPGED